jgi:hypothetical protein
VATYIAALLHLLLHFFFCHGNSVNRIAADRTSCVDVSMCGNLISKH